MTIKEAQTAVDKWIKEYGVRYFSELTNMAVLTEEVGELARVISRRYGEQSWKATDPRAAGRPWAMKWPTCCGCCSVWPTRRAST